VSPSPRPDDTIAAVSTPPGRSGIGVIRVSGESAEALVEGFFESADLPADRLARYGVFRGPDHRALDDVVVTLFKAPRSYTGEDVAEISAHGNPAVLNSILDTLIAAGARQAEPGEFTLRAVAHGKLDLAQAEAVRDFIAAQTTTQARTAMGQKAGGLSKRVQPETEALAGIVAELEAGIDFAEDDVPVPDGVELRARVLGVASALGRLRETFGYGKLLAEGLRLAIAGRPNTGKSSIFNSLTVDGRAIVTDVPGTTRDVLTGWAEMAGVPLRFTDTAGMRPTRDRVEAIGVDRALEALSEADLILVVLDSARGLDEDDESVLKRVAALPHLVVVNKRDLPHQWDRSRFHESLYVSALTGEGMDQLRGAIEHYVAESRPADADDFVITSRRQHDALSDAGEKLGAAARGLAAGVPHEMILLDLYAALSAVGELTGEVTTDDILDRVFSTFCIGK
jgi:tRNA modification GTPase